jgi:hypothetical protein
MCNLGLLISDIVEVLLLDRLLLNSFLLLLELKSDLFLLNFLQFSLNKSVIDFTLLGCLNPLKKCSLLVQFILASSLCSCSGRNVFLIGMIRGLQILCQDGKLLLGIVNAGGYMVNVTDDRRGVIKLIINAVTVTTNESYCTCLSFTTYT